MANCCLFLNSQKLVGKEFIYLALPLCLFFFLDNFIPFGEWIPVLSSSKLHSCNYCLTGGFLKSLSKMAVVLQNSPPRSPASFPFSLPSQASLSLCWAKSTCRKGRTSHCTQSLPTCPLLFKATPSTRPHFITSRDNKQTSNNNKVTTLPPLHTLWGTPYKVAVVRRKVEISHSIIHAWIPGSLFNLLFYLLAMGLP